MSTTALVDISTEAKAIAKAIKSMLAKAKAAGFDNVSVYFESMGTVNLMDKNHPDYESRNGDSLSQKSVIGHARIGVYFDVGAW